MKRKLLSIITLVLLLENITKAQIYSIEMLQGIWVLVEDVSNEGRDGVNKEYYIFKGNNELFITTNRNWRDLNVITSKCGFSESHTIDSLAQLKNEGHYFFSANEQNGKVIIQNSTIFSVQERNTLFCFMEEWSYLTSLPTKAQIVLYKRSLYDHRNYAREFLDYDICGIKTEGCQLLDSLQQPVGVAIAKDDIVAVRETCGDFLKVEYEDEPEHYIYGYVKREDLVFVEE